MKGLVGVISEGRYTYLLAEDGKIYKSKDMGTNHAAKTNAELIPDLTITVEQLIRWCHWTETDE